MEKSTIQSFLELSE